MSFAMRKGNDFPVWCRRAKTCLSSSRKNAFVNPPPYETDDASTDLSVNMQVRSSGTENKYKHKLNLKEIKSQYGPLIKHAAQYKKVSFENPKRNSLVSLYRRNNNRCSDCCQRRNQNLSERVQYGALPGTLGLSAGDGKLLEYNKNANPEKNKKTPYTKPGKTTKKNHKTNNMEEVNKKSVLKTNKNKDEKVLKNLGKTKHGNSFKRGPNQSLQKYFIKFEYTPRNKTLNHDTPRPRLSSGDAKQPSKSVKIKKEKKGEKYKKKTTDNVCLCEKPKENKQTIPFSLQSLCNLLQHLESYVDKTKQAKPGYKSQDSYITDNDKKLQSQSTKKKETKQAKSNDTSKKYIKSKPEVKVKDERICSDGVCTNVVKDSSFTCKCVERKRPNTCNERTCKVPLDEVGIIKRKIRCLCHKYSRKLKGKELDDTEDSLGFCREDNKTIALCRQAFVKKYANFSCTCMKKPPNANECTDETCKIPKETSATISRISKVPFVGTALAEAISKADDCFAKQTRKLVHTISEQYKLSVNWAQNNNKLTATEYSKLFNISAAPGSQDVLETSANLSRPCICEKRQGKLGNKKHKCVRQKYLKKQNIKQTKNRLSSSATPEAITQEMPVQSSVTPGIFDKGPMTIKTKSCIKAYLQCVHMKLRMKLQSYNKVKEILAKFKLTTPDRVRKCRHSTCPKYTNTKSPKTTSRKKRQIHQNNKKTMVNKGQNGQIQGVGSSVATDSVSMVSPSSSSICKCNHVCQCNLMEYKEIQKEKPQPPKKKTKTKKKRKINKKPKKKQKPIQKPKKKPIPKPKPKKKDTSKIREQEKRMKMMYKAESKTARLKQKKEAKITKHLLKERKKNEKKQNRLRNQQIEQLLRLTKGKEKVKETNFAVEFCTEVCKMIFASAIAIVKAVFKLIFHPKESVYFIKQSILNPMSTKQSIANWQQGHLQMFKLKMEKAISGSEKMTIMEDTCKESPIYQAFANKGKNKLETRKLQEEAKQRRKRIEKRDHEALFGCRHILLTTLRRRPCMWVYHLCPNFYPQCLSLLIFWHNFSNIMLFCLAMIVWTPCILLCELCRGLLCCSLCTA